MSRCVARSIGLGAAVTTVLLCTTLPVGAQQSASSSSGTSALTSVPGGGGAINFEAKDKALAFSYSAQFLFEPDDAWWTPGGLDIGLKLTGKASNGLAGIIKTGDLVPESSLEGHLGLRLWTPDFPSDLVGACFDRVDLELKPDLDAIQAETDATKKAALQKAYDSKKEKALSACLALHRGDTNHGGLWLYARGGYTAAEYKLFDAEAPFASQVGKKDYDGGKASLAINYWRNLEPWTYTFGASFGWRRANSISSMTPVVVRDQVSESVDSESGTQRQLNRNDVAAFSGDYRTFSEYPIALDFMVTRATVANDAGLWAFVRSVDRSDGDLDSELRFGLGVYIHKAGRPLSPVGAIALQWEPNTNSFGLVLNSSFEIF